MDSDFDDILINLQEGRIFDPVIDTRENFQNKISQKSDSIIVAEMQGKVIGNLFVISDGWWAGIFRVAVRKEYQKQGFGALLLAWAEEQLKSRGYKEVMLFVNKEKASLIGWYKKLGYTHTDKEFKALFKKL